MVSAIYGVNLTLFSLSALGCYLTWYLLYTNGTADQMVYIRDTGPQLLPGTKAPIKTIYIGIEAVDHQIAVLALFFWELVDGSMPNASLHCFRFAGQIAAAWGLVMLEAMRVGNQRRIISFVMIWGLLIQNLSYAVTIPQYIILYLFTSPTVGPVNERDFSMNIAELASIPVSIFLGYGLPAMLLALPAPSIHTYESKQICMALWQVFPIWVAFFQHAVSWVISRLSPSKIIVNQNAQRIRMLRSVYMFLLAIASITHISALTVTATSMLFPDLYTQKYRGVFDFSMVFAPMAVTPSIQPSSVGSGAFLLIQYDEMVGSTAVVLWAATLFVQANKYSKGEQYDQWLALAVGIPLFTCLTGPIGCAVVFFWIREELVFSSPTRTTKKSS